MTNNRRAGKQLEKVMAKKLGARRVGIFGGEDLQHPIWSVECKKRKAFVAMTWLDQCVRNCPTGKTPVLVVHVTSQRHENDIVIMRLSDWQDYLGDLGVDKIAEALGV